MLCHAVLCCALQVRLVLEYCDKGCLRAALDDGVFVMGELAIQADWQGCCGKDSRLPGALMSVAFGLLQACRWDAQAGLLLQALLVENAFVLTVCVSLCAAESGGINYLAILDTAADVAKAMLHLHSLNVLHSDL